LLSAVIVVDGTFYVGVTNDARDDNAEAVAVG